MAKIQEICRQFYDYEVFQNDAFIDVALDFVTQGDTSLAIDRGRFHTELVALRIELFGLALWNHSLEVSKKDDESGRPSRQQLLIGEICSEILFTKKYLEINGRKDIWRTMAFYNEEIDRARDKAAFANLHGLHPVMPGVIVKSEEEQREFVRISREHMRASLSDGFKPLVADPECLARLVNRGRNSDEEWSKGFTSQALTGRLLERLGFGRELDYESAFRFQALILGVYEGARSFIEILPFRPEYKKGLEGLYKLLKRATKAVKDT